MIVCAVPGGRGGGRRRPMPSALLLLHARSEPHRDLLLLQARVYPVLLSFPLSSQRSLQAPG